MAERERDTPEDLHPVRRVTGYEQLRWRFAAALERLVGRFGGRFAGVALAVPDLVYLFMRVVADERVPRARRGELIASALYVASPFDLIPEALFGPLGLVDDAVVATRLLDTLLNRVDPAVVADHWPGDPERLETLRRLAGDGRKLFSTGLRVGVGKLARALSGQALEAIRREALARLPRLLRRGPEL